MMMKDRGFATPRVDDCVVTAFRQPGGDVSPDFADEPASVFLGRIRAGRGAAPKAKRCRRVQAEAR